MPLHFLRQLAFLLGRRGLCLVVRVLSAWSLEREEVEGEVSSGFAGGAKTRSHVPQHGKPGELENSRKLQQQVEK